MFGIGMPELVIILVVALIVIGPKKLPDLAKSLGRALGEFKRATSDLKESIQRETGLDEVRDSLNEVNADLRRAITLDDAPMEPPGGRSGVDKTLDADNDPSAPTAAPADPPADPATDLPEKTDAAEGAVPKPQDRSSHG